MLPKYTNPHANTRTCTWKTHTRNSICIRTDTFNSRSYPETDFDIGQFLPLHLSVFDYIFIKPVQWGCHCSFLISQPYFSLNTKYNADRSQSLQYFLGKFRWHLVSATHVKFPMWISISISISIMFKGGQHQFSWTLKIPNVFLWSAILQCGKTLYVCKNQGILQSTFNQFNMQCNEGMSHFQDTECIVLDFANVFYSCSMRNQM